VPRRSDAHAGEAENFGESARDDDARIADGAVEEGLVIGAGRDEMMIGLVDQPPGRRRAA